MDITLFVATKAFINYNGKILLLRESSRYEDGSNAARYDVCGGRLKPGERFDESLLREIKEETGLEAKIGKPFAVNEWRPVVKGNQWHIVGTFFECFVQSDQVVLSQDHDDYCWIDPTTYQDYPIIDNLAVVFEAYLQR